MSDIGILRINGQSYGLPQEMLDDITTAIANNAKMIAEDYDSTKTYNTGDKVTNGNKLYKAKVDNITGTWDATKWTNASVSDIIDSSSVDITQQDYDLLPSEQKNSDTIYFITDAEADDYDPFTIVDGMLCITYETE